MNESVFFYGSLWIGTAASEMNQLVHRHCRPVGRAHLQARLYDVGTFPGAVPSTDPRDRVFGMLYELRQSERWLTAFDRYEHYNPEDIAGSEYVRERLLVTLSKNSEIMPAWVYIYNRRTAFLRRLPGGDYSRHGRRLNRQR